MKLPSEIRAAHRRTIDLVDTAFNLSRSDLIANSLRMKCGLTGEEVWAVILLPANLRPADEERLRQHLAAWRGPWCRDDVIPYRPIPRNKAIILRETPPVLVIK